MEIRLAEEKKSNQAYTLTWVNIAGRQNLLDFDTEKDLLIHVLHLVNLGYNARQLSVVRNCSIE